MSAYVSEPVTVTIGLVFLNIFEYPYFSNKTVKEEDSSSDIAVNPLGRLSRTTFALF